MLNVDTYVADGSRTFTISNMTGYNSSVSMLTINRISAPDNTSQSFEISDITYRDSVIEYSQDLIRFTRVEIDTDFSINIENVNMLNIDFERYGNTFMLAYHNLIAVEMLNITMTNMVGSSLEVESNNLVNPIKTMVNIENMQADTCHGGARSLINSYTGAQVQVHDSLFTNIDTFESGAIINGRYQDSTTDFYNCEFKNNSAVAGGIGFVSEESIVRFHDSIIQNNFAVRSGVLQVSTDGEFEINNCDIQYNYAYSTAGSELFVYSPTSVIINSTIAHNEVYNETTVVEQLTICNTL